MIEQSDRTNYKLSVVIPMFNEEHGAAECVRRVREVITTKLQCRYELIFVNDGSVDNTLQLLKEEKAKDDNIKIIDFSRNFGHQTAITAGIDHSTGDAVIIIDGDLQDPPEVFPKLIEKWQEGADMVHARRIARHGETARTKLQAAIYYRLMSQISTINIPVDVGDFRLMDRIVVNELRKLKEHRRYVRGLATWVGFKQTIVDYEREPRFAGTRSFTFKASFQLALAGIIGFAIFPVRLGLYLGTFFVLLGFACGLLLILNPDAVKDWAPLVMTVLIVGGSQLFCTGIMGEYLYLIVDESRGRPLYIVKQIY
ncbi:MAG: glycosyltransferase family 2 protein [Candidatus Obscuribacterales bacterium]|nr:glycosyltransferase family 2 protein [Candidatus Obscuribacterales bacterium]